MAERHSHDVYQSIPTYKTATATATATATSRKYKSTIDSAQTDKEDDDYHLPLLTRKCTANKLIPATICTTQRTPFYYPTFRITDLNFLSKPVSLPKMKLHLPRPWPSRASQDRTHARPREPGDHPVVRRNRSQLPMLHLADTTRNNLIAVAGEFVGTFLFLFFSFAGTQVANTPKPVDGAPPNTDALLYSALSFGFSLVVNIWAFYRITGGLFNPAVTLALVLVGGMPWTRGLFVFAAQIVGGIASAGVVSALFPGDLNVTTRLGGGASIAQGLFIEMFLTAQLVFVIIMLAVVKHKSTFLAPVAIGLTFFVTEMIGDYYTGGSLNPSRSLGPDVINRSFPGYHWIYWVGPLLGSLLACGFYYFLTLASYESVNPGQDFNEWEAKMGSSWDGSMLQGRYSDTTTLGRAVSPRGSTAVNGDGERNQVQVLQAQGHAVGAGGGMHGHEHEQEEMQEVNGAMYPQPPRGAEQV